jgi:hypothetical protein
LGRGIRNGFLVNYSHGATMGFKFPFYKFRRIVHTKNFDAFTREAFGSGTEMEERLIGIITSF